MNQIESLSQSQGYFCSTHPGFHVSKRSSRKRTIKRRKRKSMNQLRTLQEEFEKRSDWGKELVSYLANTTGLSEAQVYKWGWDQKKKQQGRDNQEETMDCSIAELFSQISTPVPLLRPTITTDFRPCCFPCVETILPSGLDAELYQVQRAYK